MSLADFIALGIILFLLFCAFRYIIRSGKKGKCSGCSGCCSQCSERTHKNDGNSQ
ncbi:MAG: FeoB-associated Cys-rich membrane protein [Huintestinicola sp.]